MTTIFAIKEFPKAIEVNEIDSDELPYKKQIEKDIREDLRDFNEIYDFAEKTKSKKDSHEKDGYIAKEKSLPKPKRVYKKKKVVKKFINRPRVTKK